MGYAKRIYGLRAFAKIGLLNAGGSRLSTFFSHLEELEFRFYNHR